MQTQYPDSAAGVAALGEVVLLHGLEGSGEAGYIRSMAYKLLRAGFIVHRFHMRTCGNTGHLCKTLYHAGLTSDLRFFLEQVQGEGRGLPVFLCGFSLGGNVALKLAGELGDTELIDGVCAVSTPIDLGLSARRIGDFENRLYENRVRFPDARTDWESTGRYTRKELRAARSLYEIDDRITAPSFGFGTANNYYRTQSASCTSSAESACRL